MNAGLQRRMRAHGGEHGFDEGNGVLQGQCRSTTTNKNIPRQYRPQFRYYLQHVRIITLDTTDLLTSIF